MNISLRELIRGFRACLNRYDFENLELLIDSGCREEAIENLVLHLVNQKTPISKSSFEDLERIAMSTCDSPIDLTGIRVHLLDDPFA